MGPAAFAVLALGCERLGFVAVPSGTALSGGRGRGSGLGSHLWYGSSEWR